jgi:hypothetical protein
MWEEKIGLPVWAGRHNDLCEGCAHDGQLICCGELQRARIAVVSCREHALPIVQCPAYCLILSAACIA